MPVPFETPRVVISLMETMSNCATFQRLAGANDAAGAKNSIHYHMTFDTFADTTDVLDPDRQPIDPYPRMLLIDAAPQTIMIPGDFSPMGGGVLEAYLEFKQFSETELNAWYSASVGDLDEREHWKHANNLMVAIRNEIVELSRTAGCLTIVRLVEDVVGLIDPVANDGMRIWVIAFQMHWEGLP